MLEESGGDSRGVSIYKYRLWRTPSSRFADLPDKLSWRISLRACQVHSSHSNGSTLFDDSLWSRKAEADRVPAEYTRTAL